MLVNTSHVGPYFGPSSLSLTPGELGRSLQLCRWLRALFYSRSVKEIQHLQQTTCTAGGRETAEGCLREKGGCGMSREQMKGERN